MKMTTINDIQDLVRIIEDRPEWRRELQRVLLTEELRGTPDLISENAKIIGENAKLIGENAKAIDRLETTTAENAKLIGENAKAIDRLIGENAKAIDRLEITTAENAKAIAENAKLIGENAKAIDRLEITTTRLTRMTGVNSGHIGDMRGLFASQKVVREAAIVADRMGMRVVRTLEPQDVIDIWNVGKAEGLTDGISKDYEDSFKNADLIIEAQSNDRAPHFIAVEISYTADGRDTERAIRNAEYITKFTGTPTYAAVAGIFKDNRIDEVLSDKPGPYDSERETRVFWSKHEDIGKPD
jgi:hypothetical protein